MEKRLLHYLIILVYHCIKNIKDQNSINFLTPKLSFRYAPGHMRDIDDDNLKLSYSNLFNLNKNSQLDVIESGTSIAAGFEFGNQDFINNNTGDEKLFILYRPNI